MKSLFFVIAGLVSTWSLVAVVSYVWIATVRPKILIRAVDQGPFSVRNKAILFLLVIGFAVFGFNAARGALWWMSASWGVVSDDGEFYGALIGTSALLGALFTLLIPIIARGARARMDQQAAEVLLSAIDQVLGDVGKLPRIREAYAARLESDLSSSARRYWFTASRLLDGLAGLEARSLRESESRARHLNWLEDEFNIAVRDAEIADQEAAEKLAASREQQNLDYQSALELIGRLSDGVSSARWAKEFDPHAIIGEAPLILMGDAFVAQWNAAMSSAEEILGLSRKTIRRGTSPQKSIAPLIDSLPGCHVVDRAVITARYAGDQGGGWTRVESRLDGNRIDLHSAVWFDDSASGMMSAMFVEFGLPTIGVFWHGLNERDYLLPLDEISFALAAVRSLGRGSKELARLRIDRPAGFRVERSGGRIQVACLGLFEVGSVDDFSLELNDCYITSSSRRSVFSSNIRRFY